MLRLSGFLLFALAAAGSVTAFASQLSQTGLRELQSHVLQSESQLKHADSPQKRIAIARSLRQYVAHELEKQRAVTHPDASDDRLALALIGFDEDLGSFIDHPQPDFSQAKCSGYRIALIHSYTPAGDAPSSTTSLPLHAQESLHILDLLCGS